MKKKVYLLVFLIILPILFSCQKNDPILIGFSNQLSGSQSALGVDSMYGALLAVNEINENGGINGRQVKLIIRDDKGDPSLAVEIDNELRDLGCVAIIGHGTSEMASATKDNADLNDILLLSPTISSSLLDGLDDNFFRVMPSNSTQGTALAEFIFEHTAGETIVAYETQNISYTKTVIDSFKLRYSEIADPITESNNYTFSSADNSTYNSIATTINETDAVNILIAGSSYDVASIVQYVTNTDINIYIPVWPTTNDIFDLAGDKINGVHGINYYDFSSNDAKYLSVSQSYRLTYGNEMSFSAMFSYEAVQILAQALETISDYSTGSIKTALLAIDSYQGLMSSFKFDEFGDVDREVIFFSLQNKQFVAVN